MSPTGEAFLNEQLQRQARALGLSTWQPEISEEIDEESRKEAEEEAKRLASFAGLREDPGQEEAEPSPLSPLAEICDNVDELLQLGLDGLKAELQRIGLKCGGTAQERAERLFQTKGKRLLAELPPNIVAKAAPADDDSKKRGRVFDQQGPLLPGKKRKQVVRKGPST